MNALEKFLRVQYATHRGYSLPEEVALSDLSRLAGAKAFDAFRGTLTKRVRRPRGAFFRGAGVRLISPRKLSIGEHVVVNRGVTIDATGLNGVRLGNRVTIGERARILSTGVIREPGVGIEIGQDTYIGMDNILWGQGGIVIGEGCLLGPRVMIFSENHSTRRIDVPIREQGTIRAAVRIGSGAWIGAACVVVAGVTIGEGAVVAAGAVVTRDVPPLSIVAGVPARVISKRGTR